MDDYFSIQTTEHFSSMFSSLHTLQKQGVLCDVILVAEDGEVMAHKVLLMAASNYFRQRLSPVVSTPVSRIYLKGISVVELANLVKYIYTGKLLIARETMEVTLEVSEILELNGVLKGYSDIMEYERRFGGQNPSEPEPTTTTGQAISGQDVHMSVSQDGSGVSKKTATALNEPKTFLTAQAVAHNQDELRVVTTLCDDSSTVAYNVEHAADTPTTTQASTSEYNFEFTPFEQQYMDVSAGTSTQQLQTTGVKLQTSGTEDIVIDEQAQHQDLLSVAIEKLSDGSHAMDSDGSMTGLSSNKQLQKSPNKKSGKYVNGKTDTKIVTLSAGRVSNDLGGHTAVYTVALDPSTIKKPLQMPRFQRRKTEKERQAEQNAKRYRQKKAEIIAGKTYPESKSVTQQNLMDGAAQCETLQLEVFATEEVITLPTPLGTEQSTQNLHTVISFPSQVALNIVEPKPASKDVLTTQDGQTKCLTVDESVKTTVSEEEQQKGGEDFSCSVDFDSDDSDDTVDGGIESMIDTKKQSPVTNLEKQNLTDTRKQYPITNPEKQNSDDTDDKNIRYLGMSAKVGSFMINPPSPRKTGQKAQEIVKSQEDKEETISDSKSYIDSSKESVIEDSAIEKNADISILDVKYDINSSKESIIEDSAIENEDKEELPSETNDAVLSETGEESLNKSDNVDNSRSSASKRKGKVPRRLSLTTSEKSGGKGGLNRRNIPLVRTRRYSRNEGNTNRRQSKSSKTLGDENTELKDATINEGDAASHVVKLDESEEIDSYKEIGTIEDEQDKQDEQTPRKRTMPQIRLMKLSAKSIKELQQSGSVQYVDNINKTIGEEKSESPDEYSGDTKVGIQTIVASLSDKETVEDCDMEQLAEDSPREERGVKRKQRSGGFGVRKKYKKAKSLVCENCSKVFGSNLTLSNHLKKCRRLPVPKSLRKGLQVRQSPRKDEKMNSSEENEAIMQPGTDVLSDYSDMVYICPEDNCSYTSKQLINVRRHRTSFHGPDSCPEKVIDRIPANPKIKQEPTDGHLCKCCKAVFRTKIALKGHIKSKLMFCNSKCIYCGVVFMRGTTFFNHLLDQHGIAVFENIPHFTCAECQFIGFSKKEMSAHALTHAGDTYKCLKCQEIFNTNQELKVHTKNNHKSELECPDCEFVTSTKTSMATHTKLKHSTVKEEHECQFCGYKTPLLGNLRKHLHRVHELVVVTKQSVYSQLRFRGVEEGTFLTMDGKVFDPDTMPLPKSSNRKHRFDNSPSEDSETDKPKTLRGRPKKGKVSLMHLATEDFTKEILKRHEEYLKQPEKVHRVMSKSLAVATGQPSFPQASPSIRINKANKLYHTPKSTHSYTELTTVEAESYPSVEETPEIALPSVGNEVEILEHDINTGTEVVVTLPEGATGDGNLLQVVIEQDGKKSFVDTMNVVSALIEAGHRIEVEEELHIQNE